MSLGIKFASASFPVALILLAGWLAYLALQYDVSQVWLAFLLVLLLACAFQAWWLDMIGK
jgi:hypothetical protein